MKRLTREQQKSVIQQWKRAAPALARVRREELAAWKYDATVVDALLDIGAKAPLKEEEPSGLVEMQKWFMKLARKQGLLPAVREASAGYGSERSVPARSDEARRLVHYNSASLPPGSKLAIFCSVKCPGKLILDTYDLVQHLRDTGVTVIGGFHSPMEQECLRILLRSPHPVIWCLARGLFHRIPAKPVDCRAAVAEGRLTIISPFPDTVRQAKTKTAIVRNRLVADMATAVVVAHAAPGSKLETLCRDLLAAPKPLYTFDHTANAALINAGAHSITPETDWKRILAQKIA